MRPACTAAVSRHLPSLGAPRYATPPPCAHTAPHHTQPPFTHSPPSPLHLDRSLRALVDRLLLSRSARAAADWADDAADMWAAETAAAEIAASVGGKAGGAASAATAGMGIGMDAHGYTAIHGHTAADESSDDDSGLDGMLAGMRSLIARLSGASPSTGCEIRPDCAGMHPRPPLPYVSMLPCAPVHALCSTRLRPARMQPRHW